MISLERGLVWAIAVTLIAAAIAYGRLTATVDNHTESLKDVRPLSERLVAIEAKLDLLLDRKNPRQAVR
jgi:hypothetical protein